MAKQSNSSWEEASGWYDQAVGEKGLYYHQKIILPGVLRLMQLSKESHVLDIGCGQGILARVIPPHVSYVGVDSSKSLISSAQKRSSNPLHKFLVADATKPLPLKETFTHIALILSLQNMPECSKVLAHASARLQPGGRMFIVINHPHFRIPRQSSWGVDKEKKWRYRRVDRYMTPLKIPIQTYVDKKPAETWSFHHPLCDYARFLFEAGCAIEKIEEWCSDKKSEGGAAKMEDASRAEIPLFMTLVAKKWI